MAKINKEQITRLEDEFKALQKIELQIDSDASAVQKAVDKASVSAAFYTKEKEIRDLIEEAEKIIQITAEKGATRGRVLAKKSMKKFLDDSERQMRKQRILDIIDRSNSKNAKRRLDMYIAELEKNSTILKSDINIFKMQMKASGMSDKEAIKSLVRSANDKIGPAESFAKKLKSQQKAVLRREAFSANVEEYRKVAKPNESWQWITISAKPCPDCEIRAGRVLSWKEWEEIGMPGSGRTICQSYCMCQLVPVSVSEELYPEVKTYKWNKESGVLTTAGEMRTLGAKKAEPVQKAI